MSLETAYRTTSERSEITTSLIEIHIEESPVLLWQNHNGIRKILKAKIEAIDMANNCLYLLPYSKSDQESFKEIHLEATLYLRGNNKSIVFKHDARLSRNKNGYLVVKIPEQVKMYEKRKNKRINHDGLEKIKVQFNQSGSYQADLKKISGHFADISITGAALVVSKKFSHHFFKSDKIKISRIGNQIFGHPIVAEIIYQDNSNEFSALNFRLGIRFTEELSEDTLDTIFLNEEKKPA